MNYIKNYKDSVAEVPVKLRIVLDGEIIPFRQSMEVKLPCTNISGHRPGTMGWPNTA